MLDHGLTGAEGTGDRSGTALGDGEHGVDDPLAGAQRHLGRELLLIGTANTDRPLLDHGQFLLLALVGVHRGHHFGDGVGTALDLLDGARDAVGNHDLVHGGAGLLDGADDVAAGDLVAGLGSGLKLPLFLTVQRGHLNASCDGGAGELHDLLQGALNTVVNIFQQAGAQLNGQGRAGGDYFRTGADAGGLFVDLNRGGVAVHRQNLTDQMLLAYSDHVCHVGVLHAGGNDQRAGYLNDFAH